MTMVLSQIELCDRDASKYSRIVFNSAIFITCSFWVYVSRNLNWKKTKHVYSLYTPFYFHLNSRAFSCLDLIKCIVF